MEERHAQAPQDGGWRSTDDDERRRETTARLRLLDVYEAEFRRLFGRSASLNDLERAIEECDSSEISRDWEP